MKIEKTNFARVPAGATVIQNNLIGKKTDTNYIGGDEDGAALHYNFIANKSGDFYFFEDDEEVTFVKEDEEVNA